MRAVKFFVIFGAVFILAGLGALLAKLYDRSSSPVAHTPAVETANVALGEETLPLPAGARVVQLTGLDSSGAALLVELPAGAGHQLLFFSPHGKLKRRVTLEPTSQYRPAGSHTPGN
ncbi:MAG: hypothetical protein H7834_05320 [Magnetococcus sp. YQC-9]